MFLIHARRLWPCGLLCGASWAAAHTSDPTDPRAPVAPPVYSSAFAGYRSSGDLSPRPWRDTVDTVGRIGGWRAYAHEAAQDADRAAPRSEPRSNPPTEPGPPRPAPAAKPAAAPASASSSPRAAP